MDPFNHKKYTKRGIESMLNLTFCIQSITFLCVSPPFPVSFSLLSSERIQIKFESSSISKVIVSWCWWWANQRKSCCICCWKHFSRDSFPPLESSRGYQKMNQNFWHKSSEKSVSWVRRIMIAPTFCQPSPSSLSPHFWPSISVSGRETSSNTHFFLLTSILHLSPFFFFPLSIRLSTSRAGNEH